MLLKSIESFVVFFLLLTLCCLAQAKTVQSIRGYGATEIQAIEDAKRKAIAQVCGETVFGSTVVKSETEKRVSMDTSGKSLKSLDSQTKTDDSNETIVSGVIRSFNVIRGGKEDQNHFVEIKVVVGECPSAGMNQVTRSNRQIVEELQALSKNINSQGMTGGLIAKPKNLAEKIYNARVLSNRGEVDRALKAYEVVLEEKLIYVDILEEFVRISRRINGVSGTKKYIDSALPHLRGKPEHLYMSLMLEDRVNLDAWTAVKAYSASFPPLVPFYLESERNKCVDLAQKSDNDYVSCNRNFYSLPNLSEVAASVRRSIENREFESYYLNKDTPDEIGRFFGRVYGQKAISQQLKAARTLGRFNLDKLRELSEGNKDRN